MINGVKENKVKSISVCVHWSTKSRSRSQNFVLVGKNLSMPTNLPSKAYSVRVTLWNFIGHSILLGESFHKTELISVWLWVYIVLEATSDILVRLEMRQIGPITYLSCRIDGPMNLADTAGIHVINGVKENKLKSISVCVHWNARSRSRSPNFVLVEKNSSMLTNSPSSTYVSFMVCEN